MGKRAFTCLLGIVLLAGVALAITGGPADFKCPLCDTKNTFWEWYSYGSYIYHWPSKFQMVFWPHTDSKFVFHCKKCRFTAFSGDFQKPPQEKLEATRQMLRGVKLVYDTGDYNTIPMFERLEIAEKVYAVWGMNDEGWCHFYRVKGYHLQREKQQAGADAARQKALDLALKMMGDPENEGRRKELLVIAAAMRHYLRDDPAALADLRMAAGLKFNLPKLEKENNEGFDQYLSQLIKEYISAIEEGRSTDDPEDVHDEKPKPAKPPLQ